MPFPQNAIGWADDPTGSFDRNPAYAVSGRQLGLACMVPHRGLTAVMYPGQLAGHASARTGR